MSFLDQHDIIHFSNDRMSLPSLLRKSSYVITISKKVYATDKLYSFVYNTVLIY